MEEPSVGLVWRDWILACCLSAVLGVGGGTVVAVELYRLFDGGGFAIASSLVAFTGILGGVTGVLQHRALVVPLPFLHRGRWVGWTMLGALATWLVIFVTPLSDGMLDSEASPWWLSPENSIVLGACLALGVGGAQMIPLGEWVTGRWLWLIGNTVAWAVATPLLWYIAQGFESRRLVAAFPAAAGLLMVAGAAVGVVEGWVVSRFGQTDKAAAQYTRSALDDIGSIDLTE